MKTFWLVLPALLLSGSSAQAYVTYNRLGYVSCSACHFLPAGGGLLSSYGRSVQGAMSALPKELAPEDGKLSQGFEARLIQLDSSTAANPFLMQVDYLATAFINQTAHIDVALGPSLKQGASSPVKIPSGWDALVVRRMLVTQEVSESGTLQFGRDAPVSGLRIEDHTSFIRARTRRGVYDYPTQLRYFHQTEKLQLLPYFNAPSFEETAANREFGGGVRGEWLLNNSNSVGGTAFYGSTTSLGRSEFSAFARLSSEHWNGLEGQYVITFMNVHTTGDLFTQQIFHLKPYVAVPEWIETGLVYEYLRSGEPFAESTSQFGPEINVRVSRFVSVLGDGRYLNSSGNSNWSWYGQVFFHFQI